MSHHRPIDGDSDDLSYEDFDDVWTEPDDELDVIDLDALDTESPASAPPRDTLKDESVPDAATPAEIDAEESASEAEDEDEIEDEADADTDATSAEAAPDRADAGVDTVADTVTDTVTGTAVPASVEPVPEVSAKVSAETSVEAPTETVTETTTETAAKRAPEAPADAPAVIASAEKPAPAAEAAADVAEKTPDETASDEIDEAEPEPPPPDWVYHVLIALPEDLSVKILELRAAGEINDMPPPGITLAGSFRAEDPAAVQEELARWTRNHLPMQIEITGVLAEVVGQQQYVAAWLLQPEEELHDGQHALRRALAPLIQPLPDARMAFHVHLTIGERVPPRRYPLLVGQMQRDFEPYVWHATDLILVRKEADADAGAWEITQRYD